MSAPTHGHESPVAMLHYLRWTLVAAALILYYAIQVAPLVDDRGTGVAGIASHGNDYKHIWLGSWMLGEGLSPYNDAQFLTLAQDLTSRDPRFRSINPYVYLPFTGIVMRPFTAQEFTQSLVTFQFFNHACLLGGAMVFLFAVGRLTPHTAALAIAVLALSSVVLRQNNAGQLNAILFAGYALLFLALVKNWHDSAIGFIAAFLMLFKLSPGILLIWFLLRREWRRAAWMVGIALLMTFATIGATSLRLHFDFIPVLRDMGYGSSTWEGYGATFWRDSYNISFNALFSRAFAEDPKGIVTPWLVLGQGTANALTWVASLLVLAVFAWATRLGRAAAIQSGALAPSFAAAILVSLLLPSICWDHYLVQALLAAGIIFIGAGLRERIATAVCVVLIAVPQQLGDPWYADGVGLLLQNMKLLPLLVLFGIACNECARMRFDAAAPSSEESAPAPQVDD